MTPSRNGQIQIEVSGATQLHACPNCEHTGLTIFYEVEDVPAHSVLLMDSKAEALSYPHGDIQLGYCQHCGFITNVAFRPELSEYSENYEETQGFSETFNAFSEGLALRLIERYDLRGKTILEIGCGKGEFLSLICQIGNNRGIGFDPAYVKERSLAKKVEGVEFVRDYYSEKYSHVKADFICCKMTLEHIQNTAEFIRMVRDAVGDDTDTVVFFQVPDTTRILRDLAYWDIYYEHCSYFTTESLTYLFQQTGFDVLHVSSAYGEQYLMIEAMPTVVSLPDRGEPEVTVRNHELTRLIDTFERQCLRARGRARTYFEDCALEGKRIVIWGAGSKAVAFLTTLKISDQIGCVVDINPHKHGTFLPGTGHMIVGPEFLARFSPDIVVVMNGMYIDEVRRDLQRIGVVPDVLSVDDQFDYVS